MINLTPSLWAPDGCLGRKVGHCCCWGMERCIYLCMLKIMALCACTLYIKPVCLVWFFGGYLSIPRRFLLVKCHSWRCHVNRAWNQVCLLWFSLPLPILPLFKSQAQRWGRWLKGGWGCKHHSTLSMLSATLSMATLVSERGKFRKWNENTQPLSF